MKKSLIALATIGTLFTAAPAFAGGVAIDYSDLNLTTEKGQQALERRIDKAAKDLCQYNRLRTGSRLASRQIEKCYKTAKKQAAQQMAAIVDSERLGG
ncbi:UrcA family protein [Pontixanthobacter aestiaquae]|uniref:UrcA family protein n=1 Tax=Pontixanthobacter aestiaquae TaxID=1509367 RepID=A0A844Z483_9SPHN|nr:UrcA family protein [Pontixanthobacter aestiaquae]MDN3646866.1 UrcA family protein [Pontixanthobacter aestiaquae]MXO82152.1 UrcA family protein [Pontixanthobacter aestiaquae]